jgi:nucleotide-binding universal stress UspA family protein
MIKNILVPASGSPTDREVFGAALMLARTLGAHLAFVHVRIPAADAAARAPHVDFCVGQALADALHHLSEEEARLAKAAFEHFNEFCGKNALPVISEPRPSDAVSASWNQLADRTEGRLTILARHSDLVVLGRPKRVDYMPSRLIEDLLMTCGRPLLIAPDSKPKQLTGTVAVGWKETPEAARALTAAMPILQAAQRVLVLGVAENEQAVAGSLDDLVRQLRWHGIDAQSRAIARKTGKAAVELPQAAAELQADLLVVGGFGRGPLRELVFGGVTRSLIDQAPCAVFMLH